MFNNNNYEAIWCYGYSDDMNYILQNYIHQVDYLEKQNKILLKKNNKLKKNKHTSKDIQWYSNFDFTKINSFINNLCVKLKIDAADVSYYIINIVISQYSDMLDTLKKQYLFYKSYNSGKFSKTFIIKNINNNNNIIVKRTLIKKQSDLFKICKEILIQFYINKYLSLSPNISFFYICIEKKKLYTYIGMSRIRYVFFQLFSIDKMFLCYVTNNKIVLNEFINALKIYIGAVEKLILNGILHNDLHDGNFCFDSNGRICCIDFGEVKLIKKIHNVIDNETNTINYSVLDSETNYLYCKYLDSELDYFLDMYYFDDSYSKSDHDRYRKFYLSDYSLIRVCHKLLQQNKYKFGHHLQFVNTTIDINNVLKNINCKLKFHT